MTMKLNPSGLATVLQDKGYNPLDIIRYQKAQKREERLIKEKREYDVLGKMYDTSMKVITNDYGVYQEEIQASYAKALELSTADVKAGKSAMDTLGYYAEYSKSVSQKNKLDQDEKKYAMFVDANRLMSTEQKKAAIDDRMKSVFYDEDGTKRTLDEASKLSKDLSVDMSQYIDDESLYKDFLTNSQQTLRTDRVTGGTSSTAMYAWQREEDGQIVTDLENGLITEGVYMAFMEDSDRAAKINYEAEIMAEEQNLPKPYNQIEIDNIKRDLVTDIFTSRGDEGSKRAFKAERKYATRAVKELDDYTTQFDNLHTTTTPSVRSKGLTIMTGTGGLKGKNITGTVKAINGKIKSGFITPEGKYYISTGFKTGGVIPDWIVYDDVEAFIEGVPNASVRKNWKKYIGAPTSPKEVQEEEIVTYRPYDYIGSTTVDGDRINTVKVLPSGKVNVNINGESKTFDNWDDFVSEVGDPVIEDETEQQDM